ncbi:MAG TPA: glucose 1-dehydrogenase [Xanthobacteraceae bacterium]|jgi:threonine dehydrogenase-like Zn-dependent dehydrogenase
MRALTTAPGVPDSARVDEIAEPPLSDGDVLVKTLALGVCGTDREILAGEYGWAPPGQDRLVLGHESLGVVEQAPPGCGLVPGDLVVGIVRRPDPVPCVACAAGEWDMCRNGRYTERGIKERNGYGAERFRVEPEFIVKIDPSLGPLGVLLEPASILAKAWDHTWRIGQRSRSWQPRTLLVTGGGPIGLLAALMGAQRALDVHLLDHQTDANKADLVRQLGGSYHTGGIEIVDRLRPDILMECTGAPALIAEILGRTAPAGIVCLVGVTAPGHEVKLDIGRVNRTLVLDNDTVFGVVNANREHYEIAADALKRADRSWLGRLITRRVPVDRWTDAVARRPGDIKVVIDFAIDQPH